MPDQTYNKHSKIPLSDATVRQMVFDYLKNHPFHKRVNHRRIAKDLGLDYEYYKGYFYQLAYQYKTDYSKQQGLKGLNWHNWRGWIYALKSMDRELAVKAGWVQTKARNHYLLWKTKALGRLEWHVKGRINIWIRKPVTKGRVMQLLAQAFHNTGLVYDLKLFSQWAETVRMKGVHLAIDTGQELPYLNFDGFKESNGVVAKLGDKSHKRSLELIISYPDWAERNELLFDQITTFFKGLIGDIKAKDVPKRLYG